MLEALEKDKNIRIRNVDQDKRKNTLLILFYKFRLKYQVVFKSIIDPDITCHRDSLAWMG